MAILDVLKGMIEDQHKAEVIGGSSIRDMLEHVMLDVAYTPVIPHQHMNEFECPEVADVIKQRNGNYIVRSRNGDMTVDPESLKVMRCRFLLWRGAFAELLDKGALPYSVKNEVISRLFNGRYFSFTKKP